MKRYFTLLFLFIVTSYCSFSQVSFKTVRGSKAAYSISVPTNYFPRETIGANVDIKYVNSEGASIVTVIRTLPPGVQESDIEQMNIPTNAEVKEQLEANGLQNISIIKKGFIIINGVRSYYAYYRDTELYYHSITQFRKGKLINLTYTCENSKRELYMPYIYRVVNSLKS